MSNKINLLGTLILATGMAFVGVVYSAAQTKEKPAMPTIEKVAKKAVELKNIPKTARIKTRASTPYHRPNPSKPISITITYQLPYGEFYEFSEQTVRVKLYEMVAGECDLILAHFPGVCHLSGLNIQNAHRGQQAINANAQFSITTK